jgi:hypothetical protein
MRRASRQLPLNVKTDSHLQIQRVAGNLQLKGSKSRKVRDFAVSALL